MFRRYGSLGRNSCSQIAKCLRLGVRGGFDWATRRGPGLAFLLFARTSHYLLSERTAIDFAAHTGFPNPKSSANVAGQLAVLARMNRNTIAARLEE
jgi:hypothetical protein